jgi:very-short-patch-repair endonuclease
MKASEFADVVHRQHGALSRLQARQLGYNRESVRWRVHQGQWHQHTQDVFTIVGAPATWEQRLWCAALEAGPSAVLSHRTAAQILGVPGFSKNVVELTKRETLRHDLVLSRLHRTSWLPAEHITERGGLRLTNVARCVFDLAGDPDIPYSRNLEIRGHQEQVHLLRLRRVFNNTLLHCGNTVEQQAQVLATLGRRGRAGTMLMRRLLKDITETYMPTESELEDLFLDVCRAEGLEVPERQVTFGIDRPEGRVDCYFRPARIVVELDSRWHDTPENREADGWRDLQFAALGIQVIRIRWRQLVHEPDRVMALLKQALAARVAA